MDEVEGSVVREQGSSPVITALQPTIHEVRHVTGATLKGIVTTEKQELVFVPLQQKFEVNWRV